jgi:hypothetical protein
MTDYISTITLFDRINLAACAAKRAEEYVTNTERFYAEYNTARMWHRNNSYIRTTYSSYVDNA